MGSAWLPQVPHYTAAGPQPIPGADFRGNVCTPHYLPRTSSMDKHAHRSWKTTEVLQCMYSNKNAGQWYFPLNLSSDHDFGIVHKTVPAAHHPSSSRGALYTMRTPHCNVQHDQAVDKKEDGIKNRSATNISARLYKLPRSPRNLGLYAPGSEGFLVFPQC
jgi:hypothetical protein